MVQRRVARYVMSRHQTQDSITVMLQELSWDILKQWRPKAWITKGFHIVHKLVMIPSDQLKQNEASASTRDHVM